MRYKKITLGLLILATCGQVYGGNPQRVGSSAAPELLINPWARSNGWGGMNISSVTGIEGSFVNVAGLAFVNSTEVTFSNTQWLMGSGININAVGLGQRVSDVGVLGVSLTSFDYGEWDITTVEQPEGGIGTLSPSAITLGLSYSQAFTRTIHGGVTIKVFNQSINNMSATAIMADAGVQYVTGDDEEFKFGITLKNVGSTITCEGDGNSITLPVPQNTHSQSYEERSASFELPTQLALGASYDLYLEEKQWRITPSFAFESNSFEKDQYMAGAEVAWGKYIMIRGGYTFFDNRVDEIRTTALTGVSAGFTFQAPLSKGGGNFFAIDYAYQDTNPFNGIHSISARFDL
jgi:hypothetical protein